MILSKNVELSFDCDALILTGGGDICPKLYGQNSSFCNGVKIENDKAEMFLIKSFSSNYKKIIGICKGMQMLNVCFGGTLNRNILNHDSDNYQRYHEILAVKNGFLHKNFGEIIKVNSRHHQSVLSLAKNFEVDAVCSFDNTVEGIKHKFLPIYGVQFHPEKMDEKFSNKFFTSLLFG